MNGVSELIFGSGVDLIEIDRIAKAVQNDRFNQRVYTRYELTESKKLSHRLAGFFAAKEALLKAMGTGLAGFSWQEIEIRHDSKGAPYLAVSGKVALFLKQNNISHLHLSISHCQEYAIAQVILEKGDSLS
jgi:holo-[acyl-carrier protein] synthase